MNALLRAAIERRDREQGITARAELEQVDEGRMAWLDQAAFPTCRFCGRDLNEGNFSGICSITPACKRKRIAEKKAKEAARERGRSARR